MHHIFSPLTNLTERVIISFLKRQRQKIGETWTDGKGLYLNLQMIAWWLDDNILLLCHCNYDPSVLDRLRLIPSVEIEVKRKHWYINGEKWTYKNQYYPIVLSKKFRLKSLRALKYKS